MYESCHTTALALDVLNYQRDAHKILGDLLEEMGDTAGAQFARSDRKTPRKRLDLAIGLLPILAAAGLACDFVVHICGECQETSSLIGDEQLSAIRRIQQWLEDPTVSIPDDPESSLNDVYLIRGPDEVGWLCAGLRQLTTQPTRRLLRRNQLDQEYMRPVMNRLIHSLVDSVTAAQSVAESGGPTNRLAGMTAVAVHVKKTACAARDLTKLMPQVRFNDKYAWQKELDWQIERTKSVLQQL